jgi:hypothetical protein
MHVCAGKCGGVEPCRQHTGTLWMVMMSKVCHTWTLLTCCNGVYVCCLCCAPGHACSCWQEAVGVPVEGISIMGGVWTGEHRTAGGKRQCGALELVYVSGRVTGSTVLNTTVCCKICRAVLSTGTQSAWFQACHATPHNLCMPQEAWMCPHACLARP